MDKRPVRAPSQRSFHSSLQAGVYHRHRDSARRVPCGAPPTAESQPHDAPNPVVSGAAQALTPAAVLELNRVACSDHCASGVGQSALAEEAGYLPLSRTTERVLHILLEGDLSRLRAESVAESLGISCTTLRRRLRRDHTSYQFLLDRARQYRCESRLRKRWLPGKCLAEDLGYLEVNSFYRAFRRWTGLSYSAYKQAYH